MSVKNNLQREMSSYGDSPDGISQYRLSELSGVPQPTIQRILKGSDPKANTIKKLSTALSLPSSALLDDDYQFGGDREGNGLPDIDFSSLMPVASPNTYATLDRIKKAAESGALSDEDISLLDAISRRFASDKSRSDS